MISGILDQIAKDGLIDPYTTPCFADLIRNIKIIYCSSNGSRFYVKISHNDAAEKEYAALKQVENLVGSNIIIPLKFFHDFPHTAYLSPYIHIHPIEMNHLNKKKIRHQVLKILSTNFINENNIEKQIKENNLIQEFIFNQSQLKLTGWSYRYCLECLNNFHEYFFLRKQHCDFTINNFGITNNSQLIVYDWEDYGKVCFDGFDIATFIYSVKYIQNTANKLLEDPKSVFFINGNDLILDALKSKELDSDSFLKFFPFFLVCFLYQKTKNDYAPGLIHKLTVLINSIFSSQCWEKVCQI